MKNCDNCGNCVPHNPFIPICEQCVYVETAEGKTPISWKPLPMTNADRIRAMTDEELMQLLFTKISCGHICSFCVTTMRTESKCDGHCRNGVLKWLQQPAKGDA